MHPCVCSAARSSLHRSHLSLRAFDVREPLRKMLPLVPLLVTLLFLLSDAFGTPCPPRRYNCPIANATAAPMPSALAFDLFANALYAERNLESLMRFVGPTYINHNPFSTDGPDGLRAAVGTGFLNGTFTVMNRIRPPPGGSVGAVHYKYVGSMGVATPSAVVDFYRMDGPCVVEHWDISQTVPPNATNPHPLFSPPARR